MYVQRVNNVLKEEFTNPFPKKMDKTKPYNITSRTHNSNSIREYLTEEKYEWWNSRKDLLKIHPICKFLIQ